jgi:hypothetical protein
MPQTLANSLTPERAIEAAEKLGIFDEVCGKRPFAAKADADSAGFLWGLKPPSPSGSSFSAACRVRIDSAAFMPGLKSRHTARTSISAACIGLKCFVNRQWVAPVPLRLWHLASLDAPTVAVVWTLGFAWAASVRLPPWIPVLLALATWAVYVADRLLDARLCLRIGESRSLRLRHRFHWRHRQIFVPLAIAAICAAAVIVFVLMPPIARERNSVLAVAALAYFTRVHSQGNQPPPLATSSSPRFPRFLSKELLVGLIFTAFCVLPAWSRSLPAHGAWRPLAPAAFFALLAWLNCQAIEYWESSSEGSRSRKICLFGSLLGIIGILLAAILSPFQPRPAALLLAGSVAALLLALLDRVRGRLTPLALRACADLALLTPVLLLPVAHL